MNVGCGLCVGSDWINLDGSWNAWLANHPRTAALAQPLLGSTWRSWPKGIMHAELTKPLPFRPCSLDAIYSSHFLEHVPRDACSEVLRDWFTLLRRGGLVRVVLPDLEYYARQYVAEIDGASGDIRSAAADRFFASLDCRPRRKHRRFHPYDWYQALFDYHTHQWMYDRASMSHVLSSVGFREVRQCDVWDSKIPMISQVERADAGPHQFILEAVK